MTLVCSVVLFLVYLAVVSAGQPLSLAEAVLGQSSLSFALLNFTWYLLYHLFL